MLEYLNWSNEELEERVRLMESSACKEYWWGDETNPVMIEINLIKDILHDRERKARKPFSKMTVLELAEAYRDAYYCMCEGWGRSAKEAEEDYPLIEEELKRRDEK